MTPEQIEQIEVFEHINEHWPDALVFHVPNERKSKPQHYKLLSRMGVMKGVSDIIIMEPRGGYHGAVIELKSGKNKVSPEQLEFLSKAKARRYFAASTRGSAKTIALIDWFLSL